MNITLHNPQQGHTAITGLWARLKPVLQSGKRMTLTVAEEARSGQQNRLMWDILAAFSAQKAWVVNGRECRLDKEDWKHLLTAAFTREVRMAPSLDGQGFVMLGVSTSRMSKARMSAFVDFLKAQAVEMGVEYE